MVNEKGIELMDAIEDLRLGLAALGTIDERIEFLRNHLALKIMSGIIMDNEEEEK